MRSVTVVGAGLGGSLMAVLLGRAGHRVRVFERRPDPRKTSAGRGRSINLAISTRGLAGLERAGLMRELLEVAIPMRGRMVHGPDGTLAFQPYGHEAHHVIHSVSRAGLNKLLVEAAEAMPNVEVVFAKRCVDVDLAAGRCTFDDASVAEADLVVGADGAYSEVRLALQKSDRFDYRQDYLEFGYKELTIPAKNGEFAMEPNALHIWPRGGFMMIALPNVDRSFTCTCFWRFSGPNSFSALTTAPEVRAYFERVFPDAVPLMPALEEDFVLNPVGSLVTVRCAPWRFEGRAVLLGDAAHAIVPFYGQGANAAFEDCIVLDECLAARPGDVAAALADYESRRKVHADAVADLALANFVEMRDKTASKAFLLGKKLEKLLARVFPGRFVPLYYMVSFSRVPYADAVRRAALQWRILRWAAAAAAVVLVALVLSLLLR
ncbi:MAG TPA: NAD(P)/FAD-dependent oxidoreductase [Candidatus Polarisedimenticolaceae bacterium]|nr:NAD(P)/FAD-dependent oxidoreductase [Candidatus Polarisedimenticolaceae bacterium]